MERTKPTKNQLQTLGILATRMSLANRLLGSQYAGDRDVYQALGYPTDITYEQYRIQYSRQDIAKAIIDRPVRATWQGQLELIESEDAQRTPFEQAWQDLNKRIKLTRSPKMEGVWATAWPTSMTVVTFPTDSGCRAMPSLLAPAASPPP